MREELARLSSEEVFSTEKRLKIARRIPCPLLAEALEGVPRGARPGLDPRRAVPSPATSAAPAGQAAHVPGASSWRSPSASSRTSAVRTDTKRGRDRGCGSASCAATATRTFRRSRGRTTRSPSPRHHALRRTSTTSRRAPRRTRPTRRRSPNGNLAIAKAEALRNELRNQGARHGRRSYLPGAAGGREPRLRERDAQQQRPESALCDRHQRDGRVADRLGRGVTRTSRTTYVSRRISR